MYQLKLKDVDHSKYFSGYSCSSRSWLYLCNPRDAFWVQICPAVLTQWTTLLTFIQSE